MVGATLRHFDPTVKTVNQIASVRIVAMADTHGHHRTLQVPDGDIVIHAGDLTERGGRQEVAEVARFLSSLPHRHKIVVAGNHDFLFQEEPQVARALMQSHGLIYLEDSEVILEGLRIWGSPWQPWFYDWAFNLQRGPDLDTKWQLIPRGVDVLVTHGPPAGMGDLCDGGRRVGCGDLLRHLDRVKPRLHLFGHIHEDRGEWRHDATRIINVTTSECALPCTVVDLSRAI